MVAIRMPRTIKVIYRNYIPLYSAYSSFWLAPLQSFTVEIPPVKPYLQKLYPLYSKLHRLPGFALVVKWASRLLFRHETSSSADVFFYAGVPPTEPGPLPFVVDFEHVHALLNFAAATKSSSEKLRAMLRHPKCRALLPWSMAAGRTLVDWWGSDFNEVAAKMTVLYPALPHYESKLSSDTSILGDDPALFNLIFIGKDPYRKGLQETLPAFLAALKDHPHLRLSVVSDTPRSLLNRYRHIPEIRFFKPHFSHEDLIRKFLLPGHLFVMPTHADTFGMAYLEALSCGTPVIATSQFALPEIVEDQKTGILLEHAPLFLDQPGIPKERLGLDYLLPENASQELIGAIRKAICSLSNNPKVYLQMKENTRSLFAEKGKFSLSRRNTILEQLLSE